MRYLIALLIAGCVSTPAEMRQRAPELTHQSAMPAREAARCLALEAEEMTFNLAPLAALWREATAPGAYEVIVRTGDGVLALVAEVTPAASGSVARMWHHRLMLEHWSEVAATMAKGC